MTGLDLILPLVGFTAIALGGRALAMKLRRDGHGEMLDALHAKALSFQLKWLRGKALLLRPPMQTLRHRPGPERSSEPENTTHLEQP